VPNATDGAANLRRTAEGQMRLISAQLTAQAMNNQMPIFAVAGAS